MASIVAVGDCPGAEIVAVVLVFQNLEAPEVLPVEDPFWEYLDDWAEGHADDAVAADAFVPAAEDV